MKYAAYNEYKTSLTDWLPLVPAHWNSNRLRHLLSERLQYGANESAELDDPDLPRYVRITDIDENDSLRDETFRSLPEETARPYLLKDGDVLFARSGATSGKTFLYRNTWGRCAYAGYLIRARLDQKKLLPSFLRYFTASSNYWQWLSSSYIQATIQNVSAEKYADLWLPVPPLEEQQTIARFLDAKTAQIDALVKHKRQLITKLREKRSALIARTVTRGLPPEAAEVADLEPSPEMKDSEVDWLGKIPEHWQLVSLFRVAQSIQTGPFGTQLHHADYVDDEVPLINPIHLVDGRLQSDSKNTVTPETAARLSRYKLTSGEIVFARRGDIGRCGVVLPEQEGWLCGTGSMVVRLLAQYCDSHYYALVFQSAGFRSLLELNAVGTTMLNLNPSILGRMLVPVPPLVEQQSIVVFIGNEAAKIDSLIQQVESAITRLTEYRQALITSAVTGKIDVRDWQSELEAA